MPSEKEALMPPPWDPQGKPVLDEKKRECSHYRRRFPALNRVSWSASMSSAIGVNVASYSVAEFVLRHWMALRPGLLESLGTLEARPYPWMSGEKETQEQLSKTHSWGVYFYCELKEWLPKPSTEQH